MIRPRGRRCAMSNRLVTLDDKYTAREGRVFMSGLQALVRLPMAQMRRARTWPSAWVNG